MSNDEMKEEIGIRIVTLEDCDYCKWLKDELDGCGINYTNIDAIEFNDFSNSIENRFKTKTYPIVFIDLGLKVIALVGETSLEMNETLRTFDTIPHLVGIIKSYIK
jgi:glutaredoxin